MSPLLVRQVADWLVLLKPRVPRQLRASSQDGPSVYACISRDPIDQRCTAIDALSRGFAARIGSLTARLLGLPENTAATDGWEG